MRLSGWLPAILPALVIMGSGCEKWRNNREPLTSEDHTLAEACFNNIFSHVIIAASAGGDLLTGTCFSFAAGSGFPQTFTVDFGSKGCTDLLGFAIYGKIHVTLSDSIQSSNAVLTAIPEGLYSNRHMIEGTVTITNTGAGSSGNQKFHMTVSDGVITAQEAEAGEDYTVTWECDYHLELLERNNEAILLDDLYRITGAASGINREGRNFTAEITEPLNKFVNCRWPGTGKAKIAPDELKERHLNYGDCIEANCCDNVAKEEVRWVDKTVRMK